MRTNSSEVGGAAAAARINIKLSLYINFARAQRKVEFTCRVKGHEGLSAKSENKPEMTAFTIRVAPAWTPYIAPQSLNAPCLQTHPTRAKGR